MSDTEREALEEVLTEILSEPLGAIVTKVGTGDYLALNQLGPALLRVVVDFVIADRQVQFDCTRFDFIDRAAIATMAGRELGDENHDPVSVAYDVAERMWAERELRRNNPKEDPK